MSRSPVDSEETVVRVLPSPGTGGVGDELVVTLEAHRRLPAVWFGPAPAGRLHR